MATDHVDKSSDTKLPCLADVSGGRIKLQIDILIESNGFVSLFVTQRPTPIAHPPTPKEGGRGYSEID